MYWYLVLKNWLEQQEGQDLTEYALLIAVIAIIVVVGAAAFGQSLLTWFNSLAAAIPLSGT